MKYKIKKTKKWSECKIYVRECKKEEVIEIDTFNELKLIDDVYNV